MASQQKFRFVIPQKLEDLLHPLEDPNIYYVNDELTALEINERLPETENNLRNDPLSILREFEVLFSVLKNFNDFDSRIVDRTWVLINRTTESFKEQLRELFSVLNDSLASQNNSQNHNTSTNSNDTRNNLFESLQEKLDFSNSLKMLTYLNCSFIQNFEDTLTADSRRQNFNDSYSESQTPARRRKKTKANDLNTSKSGFPFKDYDRFKERAMKNLAQFISMPLLKVSDSATEAQEIVAQIMKVCYKMIENSAVNHLTRNKDLLDLNFSMIGMGIEKYNQSMTFCLKFMQLLQYREQLAPLLADLVEHIVTRHDQRLLIGEILREIDRIDIRELSRDSSCPRAVSTFLINLSEKCPRDFIPSLDHIYAYLEQDSYIMRNASLSVMCNLILKALHNDEENKNLRDDLLDVLLSHVKDITGYTRSKALAVWCTLSDKQCIPLSFVIPVTSVAIGRLNDKSCFVRKSAVKFIISILSQNPYSRRLPLQTFVTKYNDEKEILKKLMDEEKKLDSQETEIATNGTDRETNDNGSNDKEVSMVIEQSGDELDNSQQSADTTIISQSEARPRASSQIIAEETPIIAQKRKVDFLKNTINFVTEITKAIPITTELLNSKNVTDIQEAIDFFVYCHEFGIDEALVGFKRMILLINVQEKSIQDTVLAAYRRIFFESTRYDGKSNRDALVVCNLLNFVQTASIGECLALEILMGHFLTGGDFTTSMKHELWAWFSRKKPTSTIEQSVASIQLIGMIASHQPEEINQNLHNCIQFGLSTDGRGEIQSRLVRETCFAIRKSLPRKIEDKPRSMRLSRDDELFTRLETILTDTIGCMESHNWFSMCDEALRIIYDIAESPDKICESIYESVSQQLLATSVQCSNSLAGQETNRNDSPDLQFLPSTIQTTCVGGMTVTGLSSGLQNTGSQQTIITHLECVHPIILARFVHFLGSVALNLAVFLELHVLLELKIRNAKNSNDNSANNISAHNISISSRRRSRRYGASNGNVSKDEANLEEEIGLAGAEAEDQEMEFIGSICDEEIVCGRNLLAKLSRVIIQVSTDPDRYPHPELKKSSALALSKYMMVSAKYCNDHLRLLFTMLEKSKDSDIKINLIVAISDLCIRFPNQLDSWNGKIFDCLQNDDVAVRRVALKILSRLVLCDILKAKDQIYAMANLIVDPDEQIANYSKHFFQELSKKLNAIYNVLPDIISRLSDTKTGIAEDSFRIVMKFLFELIDKSAHIDRLVDKLCGRFMDTDNERQWSDLAYCLSLLKYGDKSIMKLIDKFDCYKDKLCIDSVRESIMVTVTTYRKTPHLRAEMKSNLDDFEARIAKSAGEVAEDQQEPGAEAENGHVAVDGEQAMETDDAEMETEPTTATTTPDLGRTTRNRTKNAKKIVESEDEPTEDEDDDATDDNDDDTDDDEDN